jgi:Membrane dipeptidase (Peptidase family M19)
VADGRKGSDSLADFSRQLQIETFETAGVAVLEQSHEPAGAAAVDRLRTRTIIAAASYPPPRGNGGADGCSPKEALDRLQPAGAFIFGWEYTQPGSFRKRDFPPRPAHFRFFVDQCAPTEAKSSLALEGFAGPDDFPSLVSVLRERGYDGQRLEAIMCGNWLRILREALPS